MTLVYVLLAAFLLRFAAGIARVIGAPALGILPTSWWDGGYSILGLIAINLAEGKGFHEGPLSAFRLPLYPLLLAIEYLLAGRSSLVPVLLQAMIGTGTVLMVWLIARTVFGDAEARVASLMAMGYPYYVAHDTVQQETGLFTFLVAGTVYSLVKAVRSASLGDHAVAGVWIGLTVLCKESILPFLPLALAWLYAISTASTRDRRATRIGVILVLATLVVSPWLIRNTLIFGKPVLTASLGFRLWVGHNEFTLAHYPWDSIDRSTGLAYDALSTADREELGQLGELERDKWFMRRALAFIREHPATALKYAVVKVLTGFSPIISPVGRSWWRVIAYTASYVPILALAVIGAVTARSRWRPLLLLYILVVSFVGVSVVAHAHTSHRSHLDVYLMVLASHAVVRFRERRSGAAGMVSVTLSRRDSIPRSGTGNVAPSVWVRTH